MFLTPLVLLNSWLAVAAGAEIRVVTVPEGAEVWLETVRVGTTTRDGLVLMVEAGVLQVSVRKDGFKPEERTITVEAGSGPKVVLIELQPDIPAPAPDSWSEAKATPQPAPPPLLPRPMPGGRNLSLPEGPR